MAWLDIWNPYYYYSSAQLSCARLIIKCIHRVVWCHMYIFVDLNAVDGHVKCWTSVQHHDFMMSICINFNTEHAQGVNSNSPFHPNWPKWSPVVCLKCHVHACDDDYYLPVSSGSLGTLSLRCVARSASLKLRISLCSSERLGRKKCLRTDLRRRHP